MKFRLRELRLIREINAEVVMRFGEIRIESHGFGERGDGFLRSAQVRQPETKVIPGDRAVGRDADAAFEECCAVPPIPELTDGTEYATSDQQYRQSSHNRNPRRARGAIRDGPDGEKENADAGQIGVTVRHR